MKLKIIAKLEIDKYSKLLHTIKLQENQKSLSQKLHILKLHKMQFSLSQKLHID